MVRQVPMDTGHRGSDIPTIFSNGIHQDLHQPAESCPKPIPKRGHWRSRREFLLTSIGSCVGLANLWRFPYVAKENGGGTFLIAYVILTGIFGMPMCLMESVLGQYSGLGPLGIWKCCPVAKGIGFTNLLTCILTLPVYCVVAAYSVFYMVAAFSNILPWAECESWWGADDSCWKLGKGHWPNQTNHSATDVILHNPSSAFIEGTDAMASQEYWEKYVLNLQASGGITEIGSLRWPLVLCLFFCWIVVFVCIIKGIKSAGKVVQFTALFPYVMLLIMLIRGATLDGGLDGIIYFFTPDWYGLLSIKVWKNAAQQFLLSMGVATGGKAAFASYNVFHHKVHIDAWITWAADFFASLLASMVVFAVLGSMAYEAQTTIDKLPVAAQGLTFVVYPEIAAKMMVPQLWLFLFFFMLFVLRIDNQFCMVQVFFTSIQDEIPRLRSHKTICLFLLCMAFFLIGLPSVTDGGQYVIRLIDVYTSGWIVLLVAFLEVTSVAWIYGLPRFSKDIQLMLGMEPCLLFKTSWAFGCPFIIISILILYCINFPQAVYEEYVYPFWAQMLGWALAGICLIPIPLVATMTIVKAWNSGDICAAFRPKPDWGPNANGPGYWESLAKKDEFMSTTSIQTYL